MVNLFLGDGNINPIEGYIHMDVSKNRGVSPQIIHFNRVFHYKPSILGYPYFWKHPYLNIMDAHVYSAQILWGCGKVQIQKPVDLYPQVIHGCSLGSRFVLMWEPTSLIVLRLVIGVLC